MELEDLLKMTGAPTKELTAELATDEGKKLPAEIRWLTVRTFIPKNANGAMIPNLGVNLNPAIKACRDYLAAHPSGSRSLSAAWMIAEALQSAGRAADAIAAYRDFIAGNGFSLPDGDAADAIDGELHETPANHFADLKMRALFRIGQILAGQKMQEEAIAAWRQYVKDHPNGPEWSESQAAIINAEFQMGPPARSPRR